MQRSINHLLGTVFAAVALTAGAAEAQIVSVQRSAAGVYVRAPLVRVHVAPGGATSVRAPFTAVDSPGGTYVGRRGRVFARRQFWDQQQAAAARQQAGAAAPLTEAPRYVSPPTIANSEGPTLADPNYVYSEGVYSEGVYSEGVYSEGVYSEGASSAGILPAVATEQPFPTAEDLAAMDDVMLLNALLDVSTRLDARLARFDTGNGWQRYLRLPEGALPPPAEDGSVKLGMAALNNMLIRFDKVAVNPKFVKIASLPSFVSTRAALKQVTKRFGEAEILASGIAKAQAQNEVLPTPQRQPQRATPSEEHSIIKR